MNELDSYDPGKFRHPIPLPYPVIFLLWVIVLIACQRFYHAINIWLWFVGPGLALLKLYFDAEVIGQIRDNPAPRYYSFHAPGVWAQLEQTLKTLPGYFKNVSVNINYQLLQPPKGKPMQLDAIITMTHPDVDKSTLDPSKQNDMKSRLVLSSTIMPMGNKCILTLRFKTDPLLGRQPLDEVIMHICDHVDKLVSQFEK